METQVERSKYIDTPVAKQGLAPDEMLSYLSSHTEVSGLVESYTTLMAIAKDVRAQDGRAFLVGGAVRDEVLGIVPQDFDVEVHGVSPRDLEKLLTKYGVAESTGKSFGTYKLPSSISKIKIEVALPRRDSQVGVKHTDVEVDIRPDLGLTEAARRREFTIGAIYKDILSGEIYDPFHGIDDIGSKILRMVDAGTFGDDALRVLRGAAHAARFDLTVEEETKQVMRGMVEKIGYLPKDRLREEWTNLVTKGQQPSLGIELLREVGVLERWYPELAKLWSTPQNPVQHPEGDVGTHTMLVIDQAAILAREHAVPSTERKELIFAALLHDIGKITTTKEIDGLLQTHGHEAAGAQPTEAFLESIGIPPTSIRHIVALVTNHMRPPYVYRQRAEITDRALRKLAKDIGPGYLWCLVLLGEADHRGRGPFATRSGAFEFPDTTKYHAWWQEQITRLALDQAPAPILWGRDLVEGQRAWPAGPLVGQAVRLSEQLAIDGLTREHILNIIDDATSPEEALQELRRRASPDDDLGE